MSAMRDDFDSYVVCLVGSKDNPEPFAHFLAPSDAAGYAQNHLNAYGVQRAYVFGVATTATRAAFSAVMNGEAELVDTMVRGTIAGSSRGGQ